jgi:small-conductance mechanosensitive channel
MEYIITGLVILAACFSLYLHRKSKVNVDSGKKKKMIFWSRVLLMPLILSVILVIYILYMSSYGMFESR